MSSAATNRRACQCGCGQLICVRRIPVKPKRTPLAAEYVHLARGEACKKVQTAIRNGQLQRSETCEQCGRKDGIEGHHDDYSKPLEVRWLCRTCHGKADVARRELERKRAARA